MLAVVSGHMFTEGPLIAHATPGSLPFCLLLGSGARVATNLFVMLGCWFLAGSTMPGSPPFAPGRRWWRLHFTVLCWSAPLTFLALALGATPGPKDILRGFLPFFGRPLWFASAWMSLLLLVPFLRHAFELPPRRLGALVAVGGLLFSFNSTIADFREGYLVDTFWFCYVYVFLGWVRLHASARLRRVPPLAALAAGLALYAAMVLPEWWARAHSGAQWAGAVHAVAERFLADIKCLPNFLCALSLFAFFARLRIRPVRWVNAAARPAFAVYVAHQTPALWPVLWSKIVRCPDWWGTSATPLFAVFAVIALYATVAVVETVRIRHLEPLFTRSRLFVALVRVLDRFAGC